MKLAVAVLCLAVAKPLHAIELNIASEYPVYSPGAGGTKDTCSGVTCAPLECVPPFGYKTPDDFGTCCPVCWSEIKVPEDRSWAKGLGGGIGPNNNADPILCRGVMCPPLDCPEFDQVFDGRCCTKCKSSLRTSLADRKAAYK